MKVGLIGLRGVGKTAVFAALTGLEPQPAGGGKVTAQLGHVAVPDARVDWCSALFKPKKTTYAGIDFVDITPATADAGAGLEPEVLNHLRATDALVQVLQGFENPAGAFRSGPPDPAADLATMDAELLVADLLVVEKRLERLEKEHNTKILEYAVLNRCKDALEAEQSLRMLELTTEEAKTIVGFRFLTQLPMLVLVNVAEDDAGADVPAAVTGGLAGTGAEAMTLAAPLEAEIAQLDAEEQTAFLADLGLEQPASARFIQQAYGLLDLITFLTVGEDEVRAWPVRRGTIAVDAAGTIHSDLARGFIRAEVVAFADFEQAGGMAAAKQRGTLRLEGKEYLVQDGDILHVRFNV